MKDKNPFGNRMSQFFTSSKGLAAFLAIFLLVVMGASTLILLPHFSVTQQDSSIQTDSDFAWKPSVNARRVTQGGFLPWYQGSLAQEASLGVYVERGGGSQRFGMLADPLVQDTASVSSKMSAEEAIALAKGHAKVAEFLETHPTAEEEAFFDGTYWHVDFFILDDWEDWAYVMIKDETSEIVQVYIVTGDDVYLEWPNADLTINQVVDLVLADSFTTTFMETFNLTIMDSWIWFDGEDNWYISFWAWEDVLTSNGSDEFAPSFGDVLAPELPVVDPLSDFPSYYWLTDVVSDDQGQLTATRTNYYNFAEVQHSSEEVTNHALALEATQSFFERNENVSYISLDEYLEITHDASGTTNVYWWLEFYAWPSFVGPFDMVVGMGFASSPASDSEESTTSLPEGIVNLYSWTFDFLIVEMDDATLDIASVTEAYQPQHDAQEVLSRVVTSNADINQFVTSMEESEAFVSFDPFSGTWYLWLTPTWTYLSHANAIINDSDLNVLTVEVQTMPDDLAPSLTLNQVRQLINNLTAVSDFTATYSPYGDIYTWIYYLPDYWFGGNEQSSNANSKVWEVWMYSSVIMEASLSITINDTSGDIISVDVFEPENMPTLYPEDIQNITSQLPEVVEFIDAHPTYDAYMYYLAGFWYVSYYDYQLDEYAYVFIVIDDATGDVTEIYVYP